MTSLLNVVFNLAFLDRGKRLYTSTKANFMFLGRKMTSWLSINIVGFVFLIFSKNTDRRSSIKNFLGDIN